MSTIGVGIKSILQSFFHLFTLAVSMCRASQAWVRYADARLIWIIIETGG